MRKCIIRIIECAESNYRGHKTRELLQENKLSGK